MKLHWFSPLPPARTGIAEYSAMLAPWLAQQAEVIFWTDQKSASDPRLEAHGQVRRYSLEAMPWQELNQGVSIFHIGNNPQFHRSIWQVSQAHAGVVVLHDVRLQDFFWGILSRSEYVQSMERFYGPAGAAAVTGTPDGPPNLDSLALPYPLYEPAVENALGVVVHTPPALDLVRCPCALAYMPLAYDPVQATRAPRTSEPPHQIVVFGFINPNRRLLSLLRALGELPSKNDFRLRICGQVWDEPHIRDKIREYGVQHIVTLDGYQHALDHAISQADLAINLRFPSMGEASGSQLRIWDHALPSIVTRTGWYAGLSPGSVLHVDVETEIDDLKRHLAAFAANPSAYRAYGESGRQHLLAHHSPGQYAHDLVKLAAHAVSFRSARAWQKSSQGIGTGLKLWAAPASIDGLAKSVASAVMQIL